jgi:DNA-directed RNA polymerase specialized sigma24 family protein
MDERDVLAERFDAERGRLRAVAYRMLGSVTEAEDAVQEAWLRLARSDESAIENLSCWLTTVVAGRIVEIDSIADPERLAALNLRFED